MNQPAVQVNTISVNEIRVSLIQFVPAAALLRTLPVRAIPFSFLLSAADYQTKFENAVPDGGDLRPPWRDAYGKLFWARYLPKTDRSALTAFRALVPFDYDLQQQDLAQPTNNCEVQVRAFLYPWGIGLLVDFACHGSLALLDAVARAFEVRRKAESGILPALRGSLHTSLYGANIPLENPAPLFSVVTVTDGAGVVAENPIDPKSDVPRALQALAGWNPQWRTMGLDDLAKGAINIRQSPPAHMLYGKDSGRVVWFPGQFRSTPPAPRYPHTLSCYHQNLTIATLHAESLSRMAIDAATLLSQNNSLAKVSYTYTQCARFAAGLLGRLHGKAEGAQGDKPETFRSGSVRTQIQVHRVAVDAVRMELLTPPTKLDTLPSPPPNQRTIT
jgi:hypothetical protein